MTLLMLSDIRKESLGMISLLPTIINDVFCQYFEQGWRCNCYKISFNESFYGITSFNFFFLRQPIPSLPPHDTSFDDNVCMSHTHIQLATLGFLVQLWAYGKKFLHSILVHLCLSSFVQSENDRGWQVTVEYPSKT